MSKSVMIIDTPRDCCDCPFGTMAFGKSVCLLDEGNGIECPLKPYKDAIPIEWLRMWFTKKASLIGITLMGEIESDWEKENARD